MMNFKFKQPSAATTPAGTEALLTYLDVWQKINDGVITSFKIPLDMLNLQLTSGTNTNFISGVRQPTERIANTTIDFDGGYAAVPSITSDGSFITPLTSFNKVKNYYIADNVYVSETVGVGLNEGLYAAPNYEYISFWIGVTVPTFTIDGKNNHSINAKVPFVATSKSRHVRDNIRYHAMPINYMWSLPRINKEMSGWSNLTDRNHPNAWAGISGIFSKESTSIPTSANCIKFMGYGGRNGTSFTLVDV